jgi:hypothetical protein
MGTEGLIRDVPRESAQPRAIGYAHVARSLWVSSLGLAALFGLLSVVLGLIFVATSWSAAWVVVVGALFIIFGEFVIAVRFVAARRIQRALRLGIVRRAIVMELDIAEGPGGRTMDAMKNGFAAGIRRVDHPLGEFKDRFQFDGAGGASLTAGSRMTVLVDPNRQKVVLDVTGAVRDLPLTN